MDLSILITPAGMEAIQRRIQKLMGERPEVVKAVMVAREFGDLSENAEYKAAREKQRQIDGEIDYLRRRCSHLKVIDIDSIPKDKARFGCVCQPATPPTARKSPSRSWVWMSLTSTTGKASSRFPCCRPSETPYWAKRPAKSPW